MPTGTAISPRGNMPKNRVLISKGRKHAHSATLPFPMDLWIIAALAMLVVWGVATFALGAPGWVHLLLTLGVFVLIWRIVVRGTPPHRE